MLVNKIHLYQELAKWTLTDFRTLCFYVEVEHPQLQITYGNLAGETVPDKVQSLIRHLQKFEGLDSWRHLHDTLTIHFPFQGTSPFTPALPKVAHSIMPPKSFINLEWIEIPAGEFWMGENDACDKVSLPTYYIAKTTVTNAQYHAYVQATGSSAPEHWKNGKIPQGQETHPVVYVSWDDGMAFAKWVGEQIGEIVLLPSEAEWEKAGRGGLILPNGQQNPLPKRNYPWGDDFDESKCNTKESGIGDITPVRKYPQGASPYGVLDMSGNVWEWTRSLYKPYPYVAEDGREDVTSRGPFVVRGGSWYNFPFDACVSGRIWDYPPIRDYYCGVRLVCVPHFSGF